MEYKAFLYKNPQDKKEPGKYYPYPLYESTIGLNDFVKEISHATSLTSSDVRAVILEVIEVFQRYLVRGHKVKLDGIGTFKVSFKGVGKITADAVTASDIDESTIRVTYAADYALKKAIRAEISFSKVSEKNGKQTEEKAAESQKASD